MSAEPRILYALIPLAIETKNKCIDSTAESHPATATATITVARILFLRDKKTQRIYL